MLEVFTGHSLSPAKSEVIRFTATGGATELTMWLQTTCRPDAVIRPACDERLPILLLRALRHVRESLPDDVVKTIARSLVDNCNGLFVDLTSV